MMEMKKIRWTIGWVFHRSEERFYQPRWEHWQYSIGFYTKRGMSGIAGKRDGRNFCLCLYLNLLPHNGELVINRSSLRGALTGTPVRECRRAGTVACACDVGDRIRRRRGFETCLGVWWEIELIVMLLNCPSCCLP